MTGSAFKRKDAVVRTYFHGRDIYLPVFLYLPCSRNKVGDDEFHGSVSVYFHIDFAGQRPAVSAEGNDPVGYLYAYHFSASMRFTSCIRLQVLSATCITFRKQSSVAGAAGDTSTRHAPRSLASSGRLGSASFG